MSNTQTPHHDGVYFADSGCGALRKTPDACTTGVAYVMVRGRVFLPASIEQEALLGTAHCGGPNVYTQAQYDDALTMTAVGGEV